ncbi:Hypothetical predicted protein [Pelobates cultripes]|uniref:L1 transposable element RRM domain-containing protein n=1 Tax=Pelobates cultripes TaxID=61616 RepID=A0AAD1VSG5_PELCU|nr:Hypothetical predicted protein [Pelobates cultripes]
MGGRKKARNQSVAPIFRQKPEQQRAPSLELPQTDSESEMSSQAHSERSEAPLTRRDMRGFLADFKKSVAEELDKRLCPILEGMADLSARAQATEAKMVDTDERIQAHGTEIQYLRDQLRSLEETNEDLNNRTRRNNIRVRGIPETISTDLLPDTLTEVFQNLLPEATAADLLMDRAHRTLRAPSANAATPRDIVVRLHFYHIKERIMRAARDAPIELEGVPVQLFQDLAPTTLKRRRELRPLTQHLSHHGLRYAWGHPFKMIIRKDGRFHSLTRPDEIPALLTQLGLPQLPETPHSNTDLPPRQAPCNNLPARNGERQHRHTALQSTDTAQQ